MSYKIHLQDSGHGSVFLPLSLRFLVWRELNFLQSQIKESYFFAKQTNSGELVK